MSESLHLFEGYGVELEYMIVDRETLDVRPIVDEVLKAVCGSYESEVERNGTSWSNELVLHVIETKTNGPAATLDGLSAAFQRDVGEMNAIAGSMGAALLPTAMHPWMDPHAETRLWPHEYSPVYDAFDRIFGCQGHGWSNLQSTHLNLPFCGDEEFGRLHAAIRLVLPILPALAASSPITDGVVRNQHDFRLEAYRGNAARIPLVSGAVIPEPAYSQDEYYERILRPLYQAIAPHDPEGILQYEWLNARGAIARFDRGAIEIRVLDIQECPAADLAILKLVVAALRALTEERWSSTASQKAWATEPLADLFLRVVRDADETTIEDAEYLSVFGLRGAAPTTAGELWRDIGDELRIGDALSADETRALRVILDEGCLARRIKLCVGDAADRPQLLAVYRELARCLAQGTMFHAAC